MLTCCWVCGYLPSSLSCHYLDRDVVVCAVQLPGTLDMAVAFISRIYLILLMYKFQKKPDLPSVFLLLPPQLLLSHRILVSCG